MAGAEHGAHLTQVNDAKPSVFELLAQENLNRLTKPALRYLVQILSKKGSKQFQVLNNHFNKLFVLFDLLLQNYYLKNYGGSLAENFYSLRRVPSEWRADQAAQLPSCLHWKSLVALCLFPAAKEWLDRKFEDLKDFQDFSPSEQTLLQKIKQIFVYTYPFIHMFWQGLIVIYQIRYTFYSAMHYSPILHMTGVRLITSTDDVTDSSQPSLNFIEALRCFPAMKEFLSLLMQGLTLGITQLLSLSIFFIQYLDWWQNTHDEQSTRSIKNIPAPIKIKNEFTKNESNRGKCPICLNRRTNETVLATSGFVFCYKCIYMYISEHGKCPVTKYTTNLEQLVRLYQI